jgi:hypothetical protein
MAKRLKKTEVIEAAVAIHLHTKNTPCTTKQCMNELVDAVKELTGDANLTMQRVKKALNKWIEQGWATLVDDILQVTRAGRAQIKKLAEMATTPTLAA